MGLKFRRGSTAQQSGSLAFGEPYVNTTLGTLVVGGATGDIVLSSAGTGSTGNFGAISGSGLDITGNANIAGNLTLGGNITIGDNTSDIVALTANLSSSLIPHSTNVFDLGSATKIWRDLYISTGSIKFVDGTTVVKELSLSTITGLESSTGSSNVSITNLNAATESLSQRIAANELVSSSYARTNSANTFNGNQIITGSLTVTQDLTVLGSSSIQTISSSTLNIGTNIITVAVNQPSVRFGGISVIDSGSSGGSGSFLYDSIQDEFIFVHRGNGTNVTSSHFILGPETIDNLGNETYLTNNRLPKGTGKEHLIDSNITDDGTTITLGSNTFANGTFWASGTTLVSGSSQITFSGISSLPTLVSGSSQITYASISSIPSGIVSGSSQVTLSSTTGYGTVINQNLLTTSDVRHASLGIGMAASGTSGRIDASGDIVAFSTSDRNFKENITPITNALDKISKISGNTYDWKADMKDIHGFEGNDVGVIAQEIEEVLPQLVTTRETGYKAVKYDKLVALLIEGIKEQQTQIHNLTLEIENLKKNNSL
jgi:hypothetical protein